jgi:ketosteroid isomerase-like protein
METVEQAAAIALLQRAYDAFNRGDIADAVKELDPDIRWTGPDSFPGGCAYRGQRLADVYTFERGTPIQMRAFADRQQAMEWTEDTPPP